MLRRILIERGSEAVELWSFPANSLIVTYEVIGLTGWQAQRDSPHRLRSNYPAFAATRPPPSTKTAADRTAVQSVQREPQDQNVRRHHGRCA